MRAREEDWAQAQTALAVAGARVHGVGIGGVGMAGLALLLQARGFRVSGCDTAENRLTARLRAAGIPVGHGHDPDHVAAADALVCTAAVPDGHPEREAARARGIPVLDRGVLLAALAAGDATIAVAGSHGKTTTAALLAWILDRAGRDPSFAVGGELPGFDGAVARAGAGPDLVVEADESDGTLRFYRPGIAVVTNVDYDHMEHFDGEAAFVGVFERFARQASAGLWFGADHPTARRIGQAVPGARGFGFGPDAALRASDWRADGVGQVFRVALDGRPLGRFRLAAPGKHNARNALAALGPALDRGVDPACARAAVADFRLPRRRFDRLFEGGGVTLISDYAHHPAEIRALVDAARALGFARVRALFQPHRYTRTRALGADFPPAFHGVDELWIAPVYAASEEPLPGGTSADLRAHFVRDGRTATETVASPGAGWTALRRGLREGDLLLLVGAGDIEDVGPGAVRDLAAWTEGGGGGGR